MPPNGGCEDLDMETEEEDELRARGQAECSCCHKIIDSVTHYIDRNVTTTIHSHTVTRDAVYYSTVAKMLCQHNAACSHYYQSDKTNERTIIGAHICSHDSPNL